MTNVKTSKKGKALFRNKPLALKVALAIVEHGKELYRGKTISVVHNGRTIQFSLAGQKKKF